MFSKVQHDMVNICAIAWVRATIAHVVVRASGKPIWHEKPISLTCSEADCILNLCCEEGVAYVTYRLRRWNPSLREAEQIVEAGEEGNILQFNFHSPLWFFRKGSHEFETFHFLADGEVEWII